MSISNKVYILGHLVFSHKVSSTFVIKHLKPSSVLRKLLFQTV